MTPPFKEASKRSTSVRRARSPDIYAGKQKQPYDVDEMPVPGGELEAEMLFRAEVARHRSRKANDEEDRADDHVRAMKARRHEKRGAVNVAAEMKVCVRVLVGLHAGEREAEQDCQDQAPFQSLPVVFKQGMVCPSHRRA